MSRAGAGPPAPLPSPSNPHTRTAMTLQDQLSMCRQLLPAGNTSVGPWPAQTLFFSVSDRASRARVFHVSAASLDAAWQQGVDWVQAWSAATQRSEPLWLRVDVVTSVRAMAWSGFKEQLQQVKRNYLRYGLALDEGFRHAFTEQEINANAMMYGGAGIAHAEVNMDHLKRYGRARFGEDFEPVLLPSSPVYLLTTAGVFCDEHGRAHAISGQGPDAGRRDLAELDAATVRGLVRSGAGYLARQVQEDGRFIYGRFPCFDRRIDTYNALRHASSTYAMIESWELIEGDELKAAIERALVYLVERLIRTCQLPDGRRAAFLVDEVGQEIKLGGNAMAILALVKYSEVMGTSACADLLERLGTGIELMQDPRSGAFTHVLHARNLKVKEPFRIIYYEGEAAFALCRLHGFSGDPRWLAMAEKAFDHFIASQHWQHHDHWLSYGVNELTRYRPEEKYFRFGLQNIEGHIGFVRHRRTTFPTLLELMMASSQMLRRLQDSPELGHLLADVDQESFREALVHRARHMLNGHFWPEMAMYFKQPDSIVGSFFIRHHSFRVRIDDVEHYLSGYVAYHAWLMQQQTQATLEASAGIPESCP